MSAATLRQFVKALPPWAHVVLLGAAIALGWLTIQILKLLLAVAIAFGGGAVGPL